jgi:hypothetical protein
MISKLRVHDEIYFQNFFFNILTNFGYLYNLGSTSPNVKTIILPVVLYGCETLSLVLREEYGLRVLRTGY